MQANHPGGPVGILFRLAASALLAHAALGQTPSVTRGPYLQLATPTSIILRWRTDVATDSRVSFGSAPTTLTTSVDDLTSTTEHSVTLSLLQPGTQYFYAVGTTTQVLVGGNADHRFTTPPTAGARQPFRVWAIGDSGTASANAAAVRDGYLSFAGGRDADLWLMLGDNAYPWGTDAQYQAAVFNMYPGLLRKTPLFSTFGNHDAIAADSSTQSGPYYDIFDLPTAAEGGGLPSGTESYYSFDWGNVHFVCLDSAEGDLTAGGAMATWLQADLLSTAQEWIIAFWHHPPYSKGSHDSDTEGALIAMRQVFVPILEMGGVDLVLSGHSHSYERSMLIDGHYGLSMTFNPATMALDPGDGDLSGSGAYRKAGASPTANEGAVYLVGGSSGQVGGGPLNHPVMISAFAELGSVVLDLNGLQLDVRFIDRQGLTWDHFTLVKGGVSPVPFAQQPVPALDIWRYEDSGTNLGSAWRQPGFNDASWSSGPAVLGFGETFISTTVSFGPNPQNVHPTTYFRKSFNLDVDPALVSSLRLALNYDDGVAVYLNGQEITRQSLPAGALAYTTLATSHEGGAYETFDVTAHAGLLVRGTNVLAAEVHQTSATSTDLVFDAVLQVEAFQPFLQPCAAGVLPADVLRINGTAGGFGRSVDVPAGQPLTVSVDAAPGGGGGFALFVTLGTPTAADAFQMPNPIGTMCFTPAWLAPLNPFLFTLANSFPLPFPAEIQATAPPWSHTFPGGVPTSGVTATLQPVIMDAAGNFSVGNAVRLFIL